MREKKQTGLRPRKKQEELRLRKRKKLSNLPPNRHYQNSPDSTPEIMKSPEKAKLKPSPSNPPNCKLCRKYKCSSSKYDHFLCVLIFMPMTPIYMFEYMCFRL